MKPAIRVKSVLAIMTCLFLSTSPPVYAGDAEANALLVEAVQAIQTAENGSNPEERLVALNDAIGRLERIVSDHPSSGLAVSLVTGQPIGNVDLRALQSERDRVQAEVDVVLAARRVEAEASDAKNQWVQGKMDCIEDYSCAVAMYLEAASGASSQIGVIEQLASLEVMKNGYSDRFRELLDEMIGHVGEPDQFRYLQSTFMGLLSGGIAKEDPKEVFQTIEAFSEDHLPEEYKNAWRDRSQLPARYALFLGQPGKSDDYLNILVSEGRLSDIDEARERLYLAAFDMDFSATKMMRSEGILSSHSGKDVDGFLRFLALNDEPAFEEWFAKQYGELGLEEALSSGKLEFWLKYHFVSGQAHSAIAALTSQQADPDEKRLWSLGNDVIRAAFGRSDPATKDAIRSYMQVALERRETMILDHGSARLLLWASDKLR